MTRKLKALGIVLAAAFSMCAVMASMAHATEIKVTAEKYPATLTGDQITHNGFSYNTLTVNEKILFCKSTKYHATIKSAAENEQIIVTPSYSECFANPGEIPITVNMTGCYYVFHGGEEEGAGHFVRGTVDLNCPEGVAGVDINVYASAAKHAANEPLCSYTVSPGKNFGGGGEAGEITYTNTPASAGTPNLIDVIVKALKTIFKRTHGGKVLCGEELGTAITTGAITVTGFEDLDSKGTEGNRIGVTISH